jgi:hypothetical protein
MADPKGKKPEEDVDAPASAPATDARAQISLAIIEGAVEQDVQRILDTYDAWTATVPLRSREAEQDPHKCTREKHHCKMNGDISKMCVGCLLYRRIVRERASFIVGGRTDACDYVAGGIAEPLIRGFLADARWLEGAKDLAQGAYFVRCPISFTMRQQNTMFPTSQACVQRHPVRFFDAHTILEKLGLGDHITTVLEKLTIHWKTTADGMIYSLDELLNHIAPITNIASAFDSLGISPSGTEVLRVLDSARNISDFADD